jgi:tetratricopeptide (TPR) repeat protein
MYALKKMPAIFQPIGPAARQVGLIGISLFLLFAGSPLPAKAQHLLPESAPKYQVCRQVFDRLASVFANSRPQPQLEIIARSPNKPWTIALYKPGNAPLIQLDEEVYDLCRKLGKDSLNALAVILSHELTHHYEKHDWYNTFGIGQPGHNISKEYIQYFESEADFYGCFYGELAGFDSGRVFPYLLDLVYQRFRLATKLAGYPTLEERKAIYKKKQADAVQLVAVFNAGKFLYLMQAFDGAAQCFEYLVNRFPSREILHNLSAAKLQQALELATSLEPPGFIYPVELDGRSRLISRQRSAISPAAAQHLPRLLLEARKYAEKAREIDPAYVPAYINLACIYSLQGNQAAAIGVINELGAARITRNACTIRAIAYYRDNQLPKARKDFETAQQQGGSMARYNLALFGKLNESLTQSLSTWIANWFAGEEPAAHPSRPVRGQQEQIGGQAAAKPLPLSAGQAQVGEKPYLAIQWKQYQDHSQLGIQTATRGYLALYTRGNYPYPSARKVRRGTHMTALSAQYGKPTYTYPLPSGEYWVYQHHRIAFEIDLQGRVSSWMIFARTL